jgi:Mannosylglycerate hydrolase MGH1-like glycoside hydrolase domain
MFLSRSRNVRRTALPQGQKHWDNNAGGDHNDTTMKDTKAPTAEEERLEAARAGEAAWRRWGPYVSERQWGTVREDYSAEGKPWDYLPHDHARSHAYRWGEDGIAGISDDDQHLCFALALWNGADAILKERMFGLNGTEGNHGEDVKEYYFYLDNLPSHAYMKYLYKYPQRAYPYDELVAENGGRDRSQPEYELLDTGIFDDDRYFDVFVEYAKAAPDDILIRISAVNRGPEPAHLDLLPTLWFRNDWSWYLDRPKPRIAVDREYAAGAALRATHRLLGPYWLSCEAPDELLFTENESNLERLYGIANTSPFVKDAFHERIVGGRREAVNPARVGTKAGVHYRRLLGPGETVTLRLRLAARAAKSVVPGDAFDALFEQRLSEADAFYRRVTPFPLPDDMRKVQRQAFAGLLWNKQYYHFLVSHWLDGDPAEPPPPEARKQGRNHRWWHLATSDVLSMPDKWEYPWFAAWDMAFHAVAYALIDPDFAKEQLLLLTREWYMHPNGQIPAYEWRFGDVNPPVHAWAAIRVYQIEQKMTGRRDRDFLERIFQKLIINFTWWVNRKDTQGNNIFEGGFLGLDNIGAFDRSAGLPGGGELEQADGTSWMAMYCLNLLSIALELATDDPVYEDIATKFLEHFVYIGAAMNRVGGGGLWHDQEGYYFDILNLPDGRCLPVKAFTIAGAVPVAAIAIGTAEHLRTYRGFSERARWFAAYRPELLRCVADIDHRGIEDRVRLALVNSDRLARILDHVLRDEGMLSRYGVRSVSKRHAGEPFVLRLDGHQFVLDYEPGESSTGLFGGNSNWRGPVWLPLNYLLIEALQKHHYYLGDQFKVEMPSGSGHMATLWEVTSDLSYRLISLFLKDDNGRRPVNGERAKFQEDPHWRDLIMFHEYFHGDTGVGLGASHQTGWTALVAKLIQQYGEYALQGKPPSLAEAEQSGFGISVPAGRR